jgi:putative addiction module antidote
MMLKLTLRRTGNSIGLVLPKEALEHLGAAEGDTIFATLVTEGTLRLSTADPEFEAKVKAAEQMNRQYGNAIRALVRRST